MTKATERTISYLVILTVATAFVTLMVVGLVWLFKAATVAAPRPEPRFAFSQKVKYQVPTFYRLVCSGKGTVDDFEYDVMKGYTYVIRIPDSERDCPRLIQNAEAHLALESK